MTEHDEMYIQMAEINAFVYCPKQWYLRYVLHLNITDEQMRIGSIKHEYHWMQTISRKERFIIDDIHKCKGKIDFVITENNVDIPLEIKSGKYFKHKMYDELQLYGYAQLLESVDHHKRSYGYILYVKSKLKIKIDFTLKHTKMWMRTINSIRSYRHSRMIPKCEINKNSCYGCSLREFCSLS